MLLYQAYLQLELGTNSLYQGHAMFVANTLNQQLAKDLAIEDKRSYSEYGFIRTVQVIGGEENTLSELVDYPVVSQYEGLVGHFQLTPDNSLRTPFLPEGRFGEILLEQISSAERSKREEVRNKIGRIINKLGVKNEGVSSIAQPRDSIENVIDRVYKRDPKLHSKKQRSQDRVNRFERTSEKEIFAFDAESANFDSLGMTVDMIRASEVEIEPFQAVYDRDYIVFYRNVRRGSELFVQGYVVNLRVYLTSLVKNETQFYPLEKDLALGFASQSADLLLLGTPDYSTEILSVSLLPPLNSITLTLYMRKSNNFNSSAFLIFLGFVVLVVLGGSLVAIYRLTRSEVTLAQKRQDFISAVSHELKTPLTSIRMYAELLQNSWVANEEKRQKYYNQIASEAERLTRLIQNVLNLSKLDGNRWNVQLRKDRPKAILDDFVSTYSRNVEKHGFELTVSSDTDVNEIALTMDRDAVMQILMNLVDNSLKFSRNAEYKMINIELRIVDDDVYLAVRDYGPGIPPSEMKKVFQEFYRVENEMTRQTNGTGIGLSMVKKLCSLTGMKIEIENANPGLRTKIHFPPLSI
ncbi:MAG: HAMP domain-containing histidine kinase [Fibrobacter sp.]|uniref:sensor histidine kinase n=1 Tax=Fibrobacter sp. TaxID=35828 RepID=UPI00388D6126|nr:HAMP domain-containing histidine kinase [Fibrobacter sp.]